MRASTLANVVRETQFMLPCWIGVALRPISVPVFCSEPALSSRVLNPEVLATAAERIRSVTFFLNTVKSSPARPPRNCTSKPPSSSVEVSGLMVGSPAMVDGRAPSTLS
jgi:hypothetical protein